MNLDYDHDGLPNGVEYFMGQTGSSFTPNPAIANGTITWPKDPAANAMATVETSSDLVTRTTPTTGMADKWHLVGLQPPHRKPKAVRAASSDGSVRGHATFDHRTKNRNSPPAHPFDDRPTEPHGCFPVNPLTIDSTL